MKNRFATVMVVVGMVLMLIGCAGGGASQDDSSQSDLPVLTISSDDQTVSLTMAELQAMPVTEGYAGTKSSTGMITPPVTVRGVSLEDLAGQIGGLTPEFGINVVAKDGYGITFSYDQIVNGNFITYDPGIGTENEIDDPLTAIIAYEYDGSPISDEMDGPLRVFIVSAENNQVTDGHWAVKWAETLELRPVSADWVLGLEGTISVDIDRVSFESCSAPGCHQMEWTDTDGNIWMGTPLYLLAGRVDDGVEHEDRAYNDDYADAGYSIELFAADGYNVSIPSAEAKFNDKMILAAAVNGDPLPEDQFPLRLVGDDLDGGQMVSQVSQIVLSPGEGVALPEIIETADEELDMTLPEGMAIRINGKVINQLTLSMENLEALGMAEYEIEHPKDGLTQYTGIPLNTLLGLAGVDGATTLVMTASDGYTSEVPLSEVDACENCLLALGDDGSLQTAMDGLMGNFWSKYVIVLTLK